jgi:hypothetical protein
MATKSSTTLRIRSKKRQAKFVLTESKRLAHQGSSAAPSIETLRYRKQCEADMTAAEYKMKEEEQARVSAEAAMRGRVETGPDWGYYPLNPRLDRVPQATIDLAAVSVEEEEEEGEEEEEEDEEKKKKEEEEGTTPMAAVGAVGNREKILSFLETPRHRQIDLYLEEWDKREKKASSHPLEQRYIEALISQVLWTIQLTGVVKTMKALTTPIDAAQFGMIVNATQWGTTLTAGHRQMFYELVKRATSTTTAPTLFHVVLALLWLGPKIDAPDLPSASVAIEFNYYMFCYKATSPQELDKRSHVPPFLGWLPRAEAEMRVQSGSGPLLRFSSGRPKLVNNDTDIELYHRTLIRTALDEQNQDMQHQVVYIWDSKTSGLRDGESGVRSKYRRRGHGRAAPPKTLSVADHWALFKGWLENASSKSNAK